MKGNINLIIPLDHFDDPMTPKLRAKYAWTEIDAEGNENTIEPTWRQFAEHYRPQFGNIRGPRDWNGDQYVVIQLSVSWLQDEVTELRVLRGPRLKTDPAYGILDDEEVAFYMDPKND